MSKPAWPYIWAIDFDGTIVEHAYPEIGRLLPGAKGAINRIKEKYGGDVRICLYTCRDKEPLLRAVKFITDNSVLIDHVNSCPDFCEWGQRKMFYHHLTDDRAGFAEWATEEARMYRLIDAYLKNGEAV